MDLKIFLLAVLVGTVCDLHAMEDPSIICRLCKEEIVDVSKAIVVYERNKPWLVHRYCFDNYRVQWSRPIRDADIVERGSGYSDNEEMPPELFSPESGCCGNLPACPSWCLSWEEITQVIYDIFFQQKQ